MRALIYTRVSADRAEGRSPAEQEAEARQLCQREGWDVAAVVTDSRGASRHSKGTRSGWATAKQTIAAGDVDVLVTWEASRAQRDLAAYTELRQLCADNAVLWSYSGRTYDLTRKDDRFTTGLDALLAEREADESSERIRRALRANAAAGRPHGRRLFGYQRTYDPTTGILTGQVPHPTEAPVVRRIFAEYLTGVGCRTIARHLNADGLTTQTGSDWKDGQVRRLLANPVYAGRRSHRGEILPGGWPPVVDVADFDRTQALIEDRRTRTTRFDGRARLLSGVGRCGKCGGKIAVIHDRNNRKVYVCRDRFEVVRDERKLDAFVVKNLLDHIRAHADAADIPEGTDENAVRAEIARHRARLDDAVAEFAADRLSASTLARVEAAVLAQVAELERHLRPPAPLFAPDVPDDVDAWWAAMADDPGRQRDVLTGYIAAVIIKPTAVKGSKTFDPHAVKIEWR